MVEDVAKHCSYILKSVRISKMSFHNFNHTFNVVNKVKEMGSNYYLSNTDTEILLIAAWFHDTGYYKTYLGHGEESKEFALTFLYANNYKHTRIEKVLKCIDATVLPQKPRTLLDKILSDANFYYMGTTDFLQ